MTATPGTLLAIQTADCVPVLLVDTRQRVVAAFHAGWRGTVQRIVETGVARMRQEFSAKPKDLHAVIGPAIGPCCYEVGDELKQAFNAHFPYAADLFSGQSPHLNLNEANRRQLLAGGLKPENIRRAGGCTSCQPELYFSHRQSGGNTGRMMSVVGVRESVGS
jgi:YfiH family protein